MWSRPKSIIWAECNPQTIAWSIAQDAKGGWTRTQGLSVRLSVHPSLSCPTKCPTKCAHLHCKFIPWVSPYKVKRPTSASPSIHPPISRYPASGMFMWVCPTAHMQTCHFNSHMEYPLANRYWGCSLINNLLHIFPVY